MNKCPSSNLEWIALEGKRVMSALEYIHSLGFVHLDVKATNIFVSSDGKWILGDFGSCKRLGESVTSSTFQFGYEDMANKPATVSYDWFMFLVLLLTETLKDRRLYSILFYTSALSRFGDFCKVFDYAKNLTLDPTIGELIGELLLKLGEICKVFGRSA